MNKITTAQILANQKAIDKLSDAKKVTREQSYDEIQHLQYDIYQPKIRLIEQKKRQSNSQDRGNHQNNHSHIR